MKERTLQLRSGLDATSPPELRGLQRDEVRMLVSERQRGTHTIRPFRTIGDDVREGDVLVVNDSATLPAAFRALRSGGSAFTVHASTAIAGELWTVEPRSTTVAQGETVTLEAHGTLTFLAPLNRDHPRVWYAMFDVGVPVTQFLQRHGSPVHYNYICEPFGIEYYQTIFARVPGSVEMPSASRPFSERVARDLRDRGVTISTITLHCGVASLERGERPQSEWFSVPNDTAQTVNRAKARGGRVIASGTSVVRALESAAPNGVVVATSGWTDLLVTRENPPRVADSLLSGLHQPDASHVDLLRGFAADTFLSEAYEHATAAGLRWHEFGDVHLIL